MQIGAKRELVKQLATFSTLAGCTTDDLRDLASAGDVVVLPEAWAIVREGEAANGCYVLLDGSASVFHGRTPIATVAAGAIVGEMAYAEGGQRQATVTTNVRSHALRIDYDKLGELLARSPRLKAAMSAVYHEHVTAGEPESD